MKKQIIERAWSDAPEALPGTHPILQRIYSGRGIRVPEEISRELKDLFPFSALSQMHHVVERLWVAIQSRQSIVILGDFDVDGATSTALAVSALRMLGCESVSYVVPDRFVYGYGLTPEIVAFVAKRNPDLLVTVDNGISSHAGVAAANARQIDVIITDHHVPGSTLPAAYAIVNPQCEADDFPSKCLAGVGVIFYVMLALRAYLKQKNWFDKQSMPYPNMAQLLDFVALGTVADLVPLDRTNRILVYQGLQRMRAGKAHPGVLALIAVSGRRYSQVKTSDLGFGVAPPLNAAGRLEDMSLGIACLLATDAAEAEEKASQLYDLNRERRSIEAQMQQDAREVVDCLPMQSSEHISGLCLYDESWHQGIIGLVASRVKDRLYRPVIAFAKANADTLKGSARSIPGLHIRDILAEMAAQDPGLIRQFGGHAMAAGLSLSPDRLTDFQAMFAALVDQHLKPEDRLPMLLTDGILEASAFTLPFAELITEAGPWGQGFAEPQFWGYFRLVHQKIVGQSHLKVTLALLDHAQELQGIMFNIDVKEWPNFECTWVRAVYHLDINEYKGHRQLQLCIAQMEVMTQEETACLWAPSS